MSGGYRAAGPDLSQRITSLMISGPLGAGDQALQTMEFSPLAHPVPRTGRGRRKSDVARKGHGQAQAPVTTATQVRPTALWRRLAALPRMLLAGLHWAPRGGLRGRA